MQRLLLFFIVLMTSFHCTSAQSEIQVQIGPELYLFGEQQSGYKFSSSIFHEKQLGYQIDISYRKTISSLFRVRGQVGYASTKNGFTISSGGHFAGSINEGEFKLNRVNVVLIPEFHFKRWAQIYVGIGGYWSKAVANPVIHIEQRSWNFFDMTMTTSESEENQSNFFKDKDYGIRVHLGKLIAVHDGIYLTPEINYYHGLSNISASRGSDQEIYARIIGMSIGLLVKL